MKAMPLRHGVRVKLSPAGRQLVSEALRDRKGRVWSTWEAGGVVMASVVWDGRKRADLLGERFLTVIQ